MGANTMIEWATHTFNPWVGCTKVGPGCDHCYAEGWAKRSGSVQWGPHAARRRTSATNWRLPLKWNRDAAASGTRPRVFCASLADVFDNEVPAAWRVDLAELIADTPNLDWLIVTKRIGNAATMWPAEPLPNVWLGITVCNQAEADRDIPKLLDVPARVRFLSMEPLLGPVDLTRVQPTIFAATANVLTGRWKWHDGPTRSETPPINWVIVGGESGPQARPMHPQWARNLRDQCTAAGVPFLFKQWGEWLPISDQSDQFNRDLYRSNHIAKPGEDQGNLDDCYGRTCRVEQCVIQAAGSVLGPLEPMAFLQGTESMLTFRVGKKAAGRLLDGIEHNGYPEAE